MYQNRNIHNLMNDFNLEIPMYLNSKNIFNYIENLKIKKGEKYFEENLLKIYQRLIQKNF